MSREVDRTGYEAFSHELHREKTLSDAQHIFVTFMTFVTSVIRGDPTRYLPNPSEQSNRAIGLDFNPWIVTRLPTTIRI